MGCNPTGPRYRRTAGKAGFHPNGIPSITGYAILAKRSRPNKHARTAGREALQAGTFGPNLSFNAKNIKIITRDEKVTLKGVVDSHAEHQAILKIARNHSNTAKITDEMKVK